MKELIRKLRWMLWIITQLGTGRSTYCKHHHGYWSYKCHHCTAKMWSFEKKRWFYIPEAPAEAYQQHCQHEFTDVKAEKRRKNTGTDYLLLRCRCYKCGYDQVKANPRPIWLSKKWVEWLENNP